MPITLQVMRRDNLLFFSLAICSVYYTFCLQIYKNSRTMPNNHQEILSWHLIGHCREVIDARLLSGSLTILLLFGLEVGVGIGEAVAGWLVLLPSQQEVTHLRCTHMVVILVLYFLIAVLLGLFCFPFRNRTPLKEYRTCPHLWTSNTHIKRTFLYTPKKWQPPGVIVRAVSALPHKGDKQHELIYLA